jgi:hypothetical protein
MLNGCAKPHAARPSSIRAGTPRSKKPVGASTGGRMFTVVRFEVLTWSRDESSESRGVRLRRGAPRRAVFSVIVFARVPLAVAPSAGFTHMRLPKCISRSDIPVLASPVCSVRTPQTSFCLCRAAAHRRACPHPPPLRPGGFCFFDPDRCSPHQPSRSH